MDTAMAFAAGDDVPVKKQDYEIDSDENYDRNNERHQHRWQDVIESSGGVAVGALRE
jgi:hypothetical protein